MLSEQANTRLKSAVVAFCIVMGLVVLELTSRAYLQIGTCTGRCQEHGQTMDHVSGSDDSCWCRSVVKDSTGDTRQWFVYKLEVVSP